jgi:UV DNA damage endonuclease
MTLGNIKPSSNRVFTDRTLRMDGFSIRRANELAVSNVRDLLKIMYWNIENGIHFFRIGSGMFPFMDHPELKYGIDDLPMASTIKGVMQNVGDVAKANGIRLSMHPGPYTCIASPDENVVQKSILCLEMHSLVGDLLGMDDFPINIHMGGVYEGKEACAARFAANFMRLSEGVRKRMTLENDDKEGMWTVRELLPVHEKTGVPLVIDIHHHNLNCGGDDLISAADIALSTWHGRMPKVHYSEPKEGSRPQAHADYIKNKIPTLCQTREYDVMIEAKQKELALLAYRKAHCA